MTALDPVKILLAEGQFPQDGSEGPRRDFSPMAGDSGCKVCPAALPNLVPFPLLPKPYSQAS